MSEPYDMMIVGGGPAGASAAITARAAGLRVLLLERGFFPRHKVCGEFVSAESLGLLRTLLNPEHKPLIERAIGIAYTRVFLDGQTIETAIAPAASSIARLDLDIALWESAKLCGTDVRDRVTVHNISRNGKFRASTAAGNFESRALVNATGRWSSLTVKPANGELGEKWLGIKGHFSEPAVEPSVDLYFFEGGYCGVQPVDLRDAVAAESRINACAMVKADVGSTLEEVFKQHPQLKERSRNWKRLSPIVTTSPLFFRAPQPERDGILMAGDAAGFVDPFVGDGVSLALRSGALAAECLIPFCHGKHSIQYAASAYREIYGQKLAPVFRASSMIRRMLKLPKTIRKPMIYIARATPRLSKYVVKRTR
ncbi:MAG: NAD(P)/FAD-dependent oxidoreductase [Terriglobales bacterium]